MKHLPLHLLLAVIFLSACGSVDVRPVSAREHRIKRVYVLENPNYPTTEIRDSIVNGAQRHGIEAKVINGMPPSSSDYFLTYSAYNNWDFAPFLKHAELRLMRGGRTIGTATYHHRGGLDLWKFGSVPSKIDPVVDQLFAGYH